MKKYLKFLKQNKYFVLGFAALAIIFVFYYSFYRVEPAAPKDTEVTVGNVALSLSPVEVKTGAGEIFKTAVVLDPQMNTVTAVELYLTYDPTILEAQEIKEENYLPVVLNNGKIENGEASIVLASQPTELKQSSGTLATVTFKALKPAQTNIDFSEKTRAAALNKTGNVVSKTSGAKVIIR